MKEKRLRSKDRSVGVPDLILRLSERTMVVDVTICFEKTLGTLLAAEHTKVVKYLKLEGEVKELRGSGQ